jgi:hypothetical protein
LFSTLFSLTIASATVAPTIHISSASASVLWKRAEKAEALGNAEQRDRALLAWLSLGLGAEALAPPFEALSDTLLNRSRENGVLRIFASRMGDRIRVALNDPMHVIGRVQCFIKSKKGWRLLTRLESHAISRFEYGAVGPLQASDEFRIEAYLPWPDDGVLIRRFLLVPQGQVPPPNQPALYVAGTSTTADQLALKADEIQDLWWAVALGLVAAGFSGAAVWQESRWP